MLTRRLQLAGAAVGLVAAGLTVPARSQTCGALCAGPRTTSVQPFWKDTGTLTYAQRVANDGPTLYLRMDATVRSDTFNRADQNPIAGNWISEVLGAPPLPASWGLSELRTNRVRGLAVNSNPVWWATDTFSADQTSEAKAYGVPWPGVMCRLQPGVGTAYFFMWPDRNTATVYRFVLGSTFTEIVHVDRTSTPLVDGDVLRMEVSGSSPVTINVYQNGTLVSTFADSDATRIVDAGKVGIHTDGIDTATIDDWAGGSMEPNRGSAGGSAPYLNPFFVTTDQPGATVRDGDGAVTFTSNGTAGSDTGGYLTATVAAPGSTYTMELFLKRSGAPDSVREVFSISPLEVFMRAGEHVLRVYDGSTDRIVGTKVVDDGLWHHVALVARGTSTTLYVDGVQDGSTYAAAIAATATTMQIGRYYGGGYTWGGSLDDFAAYPSALTAAQLLAHYTSR